jgi:hypothetical protein
MTKDTKDMSREELLAWARALGDSTDFDNYVKRVVRTECGYTPVVSRVSTLDLFLRLVHMSLGINTEVAEMCDREDTRDSAERCREELGDMMWYVAGACDVLEIDLASIMAQPSDVAVIPDSVDSAQLSLEITNVFENMCFGAGLFADQVKKATFYGKDFNQEKAVDGLRRVVESVQIFLHVHDVDFLSVLKDNIAKLAVRFPGKFTEEAALNRDLDAESEMITD